LLNGAYYTSGLLGQIKKLVEMKILKPINRTGTGVREEGTRLCQQVGGV